LITKLQENPNAIVLLDEIEKAHHDVSNILLQFMDNGLLLDLMESRQMDATLF